MRRSRKISTAVVIAGLVSSLAPLWSQSRTKVQEERSTRVERALPAASSEKSASSIQGRVVRVLDGDTVEVLIEESGQKRSVRVRLTGIDAPEKSQPFGEVCRKALAEVVAGKTVRVGVRGQDRYSRTLGVIYSRPSESAPEKDANLGQIAAGCAWHYKQYQKQQLPEERSRYAQAEVSAREKHLGLWRDPDPQAPWTFRREKRGGGK